MPAGDDPAVVDAVTHARYPRMLVEGRVAEPETNRWDHPAIGICHLARPDQMLLWQIDGSWPGRRPPSDVTQGWRWVGIAAQCRETLVLLDATLRPVAIWSGGETVIDGQKTLYMAEFLEVEPDLRGASRLSGFVLALICARARELGCSGVLMHSLPETAPVYDGYGIPRRAVDARPPDADLVSFVVEDAAFDELLGVADALKHDSGRCPGGA